MILSFLKKMIEITQAKMHFKGIQSVLKCKFHIEYLNSFKIE